VLPVSTHLIKHSFLSKQSLDAVECFGSLVTLSLHSEDHTMASAALSSSLTSQQPPILQPTGTTSSSPCWHHIPVCSGEREWCRGWCLFCVGMDLAGTLTITWLKKSAAPVSFFPWLFRRHIKWA